MYQSDRLVRKQKSRFKTRCWRNRYIYLMILPVFIYFVLFNYWPMGWLSIAFFDFKMLRGFAGSEFVGLENFLDFFRGIYFWRTIGNTIILNIYSLLFVFPTSIVFALLLNEVVNIRFKKIIQTVSYLPHFISTVVLIGLITSFLSPSFGLLGKLFNWLGMDPVYFLGEPKYFRAINVISGIWQTTGWNAIIYLSAITGIDQELYEAVTVDGGGRFRRIWHITLPGIKSTILILLILQIGRLLGANFEKVLLLQNDLNLSVSELLPTYIYKAGMIKGKYSFSTAVGLFNSVISVLLVMTSNWLSKKVSDDKTGIF